MPKKVRAPVRAGTIQDIFADVSGKAVVTAVKASSKGKTSLAHIRERPSEFIIRPLQEAYTSKPRKKTAVVFWCCYALCFFFLLETLSFITLSVLEHRMFRFGLLAMERQAIMGGDGSAPIVPRAAASGAEETAPSLLEEDALHPYLGYVWGSNKNPNALEYYGFNFNGQPLITAPDPGRAVVGIFGGSVANHFAKEGTAALEKVLKRSSTFKNKEFVFLPIALPGYKQPQQLMALNYLLSLGAHFDVLVNIDGFNEVALPPVENVPKHVNAFYPRAWAERAGSLSDPDYLLGVASVLQLREERKDRAEFFSAFPLSWTVTGNLVWKLLDQHTDKAIASEQMDLLTHPKDGRDGFQVTGPGQTFINEETLFSTLSAQWARSSRQMHDLARARGIPYVHILQPNQYVPGSKWFSAEEMRVAYNTLSPYKPWVEKGYANFASAGRDLRKHGVWFHNFTRIFEDTEKSVYADDCCHLNARGNEILGIAIGTVLLEDLGSAGAL